MSPEVPKSLSAFWMKLPIGLFSSWISPKTLIWLCWDLYPPNNVILSVLIKELFSFALDWFSTGFTKSSYAVSSSDPDKHI